METIKSRYRKYAAIIFSALFFAITPFGIYLYFVAFEREFDMRFIDYFMIVLFFAFMIYMFRFVMLRLASITLTREHLSISNFSFNRKQINFRHIKYVKESRFWTRMSFKDFEELKIYDSNNQLLFIISEQVYSNYNEIRDAVIKKTKLQ